jgi:hypothetical protein
MTDTEEKVVDILVRSPRTAEQRAAVHAVDAAMHWTTVESLEFVNGLIRRKLVVERTNAIDPNMVPKQVQLWWWEKP